jgi:hypothetical protein
MYITFVASQMHWTNKTSFTKFATIPKQVEKQSPWNEVKTKKSCIDFECRCLRLEKSKVTLFESQL